MIEHYDNDAPFPDDEVTEELHYFCRFTFGQFFTLIVLLVITVCSSFYLGARYGNNYLRLDGSSGASPVANYQPVSPASQSGVAAAQDLPERVNEDEELIKMARAALQLEQQSKLEAQAQNLLNNPEKMSALSKSQQWNESRYEDVPVSHDAPEQMQPEVRIEETRVAVTRPVSQPAVDPIEPITSLGGGSGLPYSVQIGAYRKIDEARRFVSQWQQEGYPAYMMEAEIPDKGRWYRVRLGAFATKSEAGQYLSGLQSQRGVEGLVVAN